MINKNPFEILLDTVKNGKKLPEWLLSIDPGETTGYAIFNQGKLAITGQIETIREAKHLVWDEVDKLFELCLFDAVVCENYRVYQHKLERHTYSEVPTLRLIGGIDYKAYTKNIPITYQMATVAKGFVTDAKLQKWDYFEKGQKHARDAIRHGCYYLLFNKGE